jgi:poly-gamma-glutamate synthesis protein (capsule biosynthesis protein)
MVNAVSIPPPERVSTKALAAAGQFRAIALWLNEPLIPQGIFARVEQDKRPGCIRIVVEFERQPLQKPLTKFICHLIWQLNSPLIEGIHLVARPVGQTKPAWEQRIRILTPALKARRDRETGNPSTSPIPPRLAHSSATSPTHSLGQKLQVILAEQLKNLRAFVLTGSAVAAFVLGCLVELGLSQQSTQTAPTLPFDLREYSRSPNSDVDNAIAPQASSKTASETVLIDNSRRSSPPRTEVMTKRNTLTETDTSPSTAALPSDRPNVVNAALEPIGVIQHERIAQPNDPTVTLVFGGGANLESLPFNHSAGSSSFLAKLPIYQEADLAFLNLEDPIAVAATSLEENLHNRQRPEVIDLLKTGGVDIVNLVGGEVLVVGEKGLTETLDTLDRHGIYRVGAGRTEREARRPEIVDVKGQRIAYLSYNRDPQFGAYDTVGGVNAADMQDIVKDIRAIRDEVDWLVVNYRWTDAPPETPADSQTNLARLAIDQGADIVIGHHPAQLQGAEIYKGRPIAYSLGDFMPGQTYTDTPLESAVLQIALRSGQMKVDLIPIQIKQGHPQPAHDAAATRIFEQIRDASEAFESPMPPSVVLEAGAADTPSTQPANTGAETFTEIDPPASDRPQPENATPPASKTTSPSKSRHSPAEEESTVDEPGTEETPSRDADILFEVEMEPMPEDLLRDWGPKRGSGKIYQPESALPRGLEQEIPAPQPIDRTQQIDHVLPSETAAPPPAASGSAPNATPDVAPSPDAIAPYSEPLVGPLSQTKSTSSVEGAIAPVPSGIPETRVFSPLNAVSHPSNASS